MLYYVTHTGQCLQLENQTYATKTGDDLQLASNLNIQICLSSFPIGAKVDCILFANKTSVYYKFCIYFTIAGLHKTLCHTFTKSNSSFIICARAFLTIYVHIFLSWNKFAKIPNRNLYSCNLPRLYLPERYCTNPSPSLRSNGICREGKLLGFNVGKTLLGSTNQTL